MGKLGGSVDGEAHIALCGISLGKEGKELRCRNLFL